jgi:hypothetical protein
MSSYFSPQSKTRKRVESLNTIMKDVMKQTNMLPSQPEARKIIMNRFMRETRTNPTEANRLYNEIIEATTQQIDIAMLSEYVIGESIADHEELKVHVNTLDSCDKFYDSNYVAGMKARNDVRRTLSDLLTKSHKIKVDQEKNVLLDKKIDAENTTAMFNVAMQLEGTFEEKTRKMGDILKRNADLIEGNFKVNSIPEEKNERLITGERTPKKTNN